MKKLIFIIYLFFTFLIYSFEYKVDLELRYKENNIKNEDKIILKSSLNLEQNYENIYLELSLRSYTNDIENPEIFRAFGEYYGEKYSLGIGKQRIVWGSSYIYNLTDVFNEIDIENPKREKKGVDALRLKYNIGNLSKIEGVYYKNTMKNKEYLAIKYFSTYKSFEYILNYIEDEKGIVLETKGDLGLGIWSQVALGSQEYVLGFDYSFEILDRVLYTAFETIYKEENNLFNNYLMYTYVLSDVISFGQSASIDNYSENIFFNFYLNYIYNDYLNWDFRINRYIDYNELRYSEIDFGIKIIF